MLEDQELGVVLGSDHEGEEASIGHRAPVLSADVQEDRSLAVPVLIADPVSLLVRALVQVIVMGDQVGELLLFKLIKVNIWQVIKVKCLADGGH